MEKGSFSVEWLARSSHEPASGAAHRVPGPRGASPRPLPKSAAGGGRDKGTRSGERPPQGARRSPGEPGEWRPCPGSPAGPAGGNGPLETGHGQPPRQSPEVRVLPCSAVLAPAPPGRGSRSGLASRPLAPAAPRETGPSSAASSPKEAGPEAGGEGSGSESAGCAQPGRPRTKFSASQLRELERSFREQRYIGASEKRRLSRVLHLSQTQIKTWFQNRRMKFKRQTQDARVEALFSGLLLPYHRYPEIQSPSYLPGVEFRVSSSPTAAVTCSLHSTMPSPALLLPPAPTQSLQPIVPTPALLLPAAPGFSSYHSTFPKVSLTQDHNRLRFQTYLPPS